MTSNRRSRPATRERLLEAARKRFRDHGFDATTVREIAADAGVDPALIMRYFGSKTGLITELTLTESPAEFFLKGDRATLGTRLANLAFEKESTEGIEMVLRSLGHETAASRYEHELHERYVEPLAEWLGGRDAMIRAGLIVSILNGITLSKVVLRQRSIAEAKPKTTARRLGVALQTLIDG